MLAILHHICLARIISAAVRLNKTCTKYPLQFLCVNIVEQNASRWLSCAVKKHHALARFPLGSLSTLLIIVTLKRRYVGFVFLTTRHDTISFPQFLENASALFSPERLWRTELMNCDCFSHHGFCIRHPSWQRSWEMEGTSLNLFHQICFLAGVQMSLSIWHL